MSLSNLIEKQYGVKTSYAENPITATVLTTVTRLLGNNPNRLSFLIVNMGSSAIYVSPQSSVSSSRGIVLGANGGFLSQIWSEDFDMVGFEWYSIASASTAVYVIEIFQVEG